MRINNLILYLLLMISVYALPDWLWTQTTFYTSFGDTIYSEFGTCAIPTIDGGYMICGGKHHNVAQLDEMTLLIKTDDLGQMTWIKNYGSKTHPESAEDIQQLSDGSYLVIGNYSGGSIFVMRTDAKGDILWKKSYGVSFPYYSYGIEETDDGSFVFAGSEMYLTGIFRKVNQDSLSHITTIKINRDGAVLWERVYTFKGSPGTTTLKSVSDGGYILVGSNAIRDSIDQKLMLMKLNSNGDSLWCRFYDKKVHWYGKEILETSDKGYFILTTGFKTGSIQKNLLLIKTDAQGEIVWRKTYETSGDYGMATSLIAIYDGGYLLCGSPNIILIKIDSMGSIQWEKRYFELHHCTSVKEMNDRGFILTGWRYNFLDRDVFLMKTDRVGEVTQINLIRNSNQGTDYKLFQNYPNPFNSSTEIRYALPSGKANYPVQLKVYDILGRLVKVLVDLEQSAGTYAISWDGTELSGNRVASGVYFYSLEAGSLKSFRKMLVLQ